MPSGDGLPPCDWGRQDEPYGAGGTSKPDEVVFKVARLCGVDKETFEHPVAPEHAQVVGP